MPGHELRLGDKTPPRRHPLEAFDRNDPLTRQPRRNRPGIRRRTQSRTGRLLQRRGIRHHRAYTERLGLGADTERRLTAESDPELDAALAQLMQTSSQVRWVFRQGMWSFGVATPRALLAASLAYTLRGGIAEKITCPVFVGRGESDQFLRGQPEELMQHLTAPATLGSFTDAEGAGAHAQVGAQRLLCARMLGWLDDTLAGSGPRPASSQP